MSFFIKRFYFTYEELKLEPRLLEVWPFSGFYFTYEELKREALPAA